MYVRSNQYRGDFAPPPISEYERRQLEDVGLMIRASIREAVGLAGVRVWDDLNPEFVDDLAATLVEVRTEGAWQQHINNTVERSQESWASVGRILSAALHSGPGDTPKDTALRMLGAHAGVDEETIDAMVRSDKP